MFECKCLFKENLQLCKNYTFYNMKYKTCPFMLQTLLLLCYLLEYYRLFAYAINELHIMKRILPFWWMKSSDSTYFKKSIYQYDTSKYSFKEVWFSKGLSLTASSLKHSLILMCEMV